MEVPQKIKDRTTISFSNSTSGYLSEENENTNLKRYVHPYVHCNQDRKQPKCLSVNEWINKMWGVCVYTHTKWNTNQP